MVRALGLIAMVLGVFLFAAGCQSRHEDDVKSNLRTQWTDVAADTKVTTDAAKEVLEGEGLKDVSASSTAVDGKATGKMADGTKVTVSVQKESDRQSQVSVNVGTVGKPALGAEIAKKIKVKAEGM